MARPEGPAWLSDSVSQRNAVDERAEDVLHERAIEPAAEEEVASR